MASKTHRAVMEPEVEKNGTSSNELHLNLYKMLVKCRMCDEKARILFRQGKYKGNFYSGVGQEATSVGTAFSLKKDDWIAPSHRDWTSNVIKGVPLKFCFAQLFAKTTSPDRGRSSPAHMGYPELHVITPASSIAGQLNVGTGVALGIKKLRRNDVVVSYFGDGATSFGGFHEALNFAGVHKLPIIYVCQNNLWAESVPLRLQTALTNLSDRAKAYGFPGVSLDGNNVLEVYDAAQKGDRARSRRTGPHDARVQDLPLVRPLGNRSGEIPRERRSRGVEEKGSGGRIREAADGKEASERREEKADRRRNHARHQRSGGVRRAKPLSRCVRACGPYLGAIARPKESN